MSDLRQVCGFLLVLYITLCDKVCLTCDRSVVFSGYSISSTNKTDRHDITEILLKVVLNTINHQTNPLYFLSFDLQLLITPWAPSNFS